MPQQLRHLPLPNSALSITEFSGFTEPNGLRGARDLQDASGPRSTPRVRPHLPSLAGRAYRCQCGRPVFFRNSECLACRTPLGFEPDRLRLLPLTPGVEAGTWLLWQGDAAPAALPSAQSLAPPAPPTLKPASAGPQGAASTPAAPLVYRRCANLLTPAACNWLVPQQRGTNAAGLCRACRLNRTIPNLNDPAHPDNSLLWGRIELAKRRMVSGLLALGLPVASRLSEDTERGLMFDFLRSPDAGPGVLTGHNTGLITLNLQEADDAVREAMRTAMREPYRTLLGHFRHEVGHYYWDRLVWQTPWLAPFRQLFGDERQDYAASLQRHYDQGPARDWWLQHVSAYASTHPWEDWAECWAHYLHMRDTLDTALSFGLSTHNAQLEVTPFALDALYAPGHAEAQPFLDFLNDWTRLTTLLNEMSRSMGQPDFYPFVLPRKAVAKLHFIHLLIGSASWLPSAAARV